MRERGLSFRQVHHIVARVVRNCLEKKISPNALTAAELDVAAVETIGHALKLDNRAVHDALDPRRFVETRATEGSVAPPYVERLLDQARQEIAADRGWIGRERARLDSARMKLDQAIEGIVAGIDIAREAD